jgi:hypothetical protein
MSAPSQENPPPSIPLVRPGYSWLCSGGAVINTASINGLRGNKTLIDYSATKWHPGQQRRPVIRVLRRRPDVEPLLRRGAAPVGGETMSG